MKLRVKHHNATYRIVVGDDCTYDAFRETVALTVGCPPGEIIGSLNKKVSLTSHRQAGQLL
jgi:hypothetical protein